MLRPGGVVLLHIASNWLSCIEGRDPGADQDCKVNAHLQQMLDEARQLGTDGLDGDGIFSGFARVNDEAAEQLGQAYALKTGDDTQRMGLILLRRV